MCSGANPDGVILLTVVIIVEMIESLGEEGNLKNSLKDGPKTIDSEVDPEEKLIIEAVTSKIVLVEGLPEEEPRAENGERKYALEDIVHKVTREVFEKNPNHADR